MTVFLPDIIALPLKLHDHIFLLDTIAFQPKLHYSIESEVHFSLPGHPTP